MPPDVLVSNQVVDIFDAEGLDKANIGILDDAFLNEVRNLPERNLAVELLERLLERNQDSLVDVSDFKKNRKALNFGKNT